LPVFPETIDSINQLNNAFYRVGTLDRGGWERWFTNSYDKETARLFRKLEYVHDLNEGLGNVTRALFLFPYAFIGSRAQLEYVIQTNYTNVKLGRRSALHISDECFALFGVSIALREKSVYRSRINEAILLMQQSGITQKIMNDVRYDMIRSSTGQLLQIGTGKSLKMANIKEKGLTLADTEGMFLLLGVGFLIATGALVSEWVGGCTNKCIKLVRVKREAKREEHRLEEEEEDIKRQELQERMNGSETIATLLTASSSAIGISLLAGEEPKSKVVNEKKLSIDSSCNGSQHSRASSISVQELSSAMLQEMYQGPKKKIPNIIMIDGKMMNENDAKKYANVQKENDEIDEVARSFDFLSQDEEDDGRDGKTNCNDDGKPMKTQIHHVEINFQAPTPKHHDCDEFFGEKVNDSKIL
jgi:hypothetical protein